jgi:hypothetical protein
LYSCTVSATANSPTTITAYGHGIDTVSTPGTTKDVTYCDLTTPANNPYLAPATAATCDSDEVTVLTLTVLAPSTSMTASVSATIIFSETNDGNAPLEKPNDGAFVRLASGTTAPCTSFGPVLKTTGDTTKNTGDADNDLKLDQGETWQWSCTTSIASTASGSSVSKATGHGIDVSNGTDVTFCTGANQTAPAYESATLPGTAAVATPKCDPDEQRTVTIGIS